MTTTATPKTSASAAPAASAGGRLVEFKVEDGLAILELNDPPANTYTYEMMRQLDQAILDARMNDEVWVIILRGKGNKFFSAGANIKMLSEVTPRFKYFFCLHANETLNRLEQTPKLTIAALNGHTVGGGLEIAMACDIRLACQDAGKVGLPEVNLGVLPGTGGTQRLSRLVGKSRAIEMMVKGETFSFERARSGFRLAAIASGMKVILLTGLGIAACRWMGLGGDDLRIAAIMFGCPTAVITYVMASRLKGDPDLAATIVIVLAGVTTSAQVLEHGTVAHEPSYAVKFNLSQSKIEASSAILARWQRDQQWALTFVIAVALPVTFGFYGLVRKKAPVDSMTGLTVETLLLLPPSLGFLIYLSLNGQNHLTPGNWSLNTLIAFSGIVTALSTFFLADDLRIGRKVHGDLTGINVDTGGRVDARRANPAGRRHVHGDGGTPCRSGARGRPARSTRREHLTKFREDAMIHPLDDYPIHQTSQPLLHPATDSPNAYDRYFFNGYRIADEPVETMFFAVALGVYPNRGIMDAAFAVVRDGVQHNVRASRRAPADR